MKRSTRIAIWSGTLVMLAGGIFFALRHYSPADHASRTKSRAVPNTPAALQQFIANNRKNPSKTMQDLVTQAQLHLGFLEVTKDHTAKPTKGTYEAARKTFLAAEKSYKGTGVSSADFGSLSDQALYQADVCLVAEGKKTQAISAFRDFMKSRPKSPLCKACFDRLRRLQGGLKDGAPINPADVSLYQHDLAIQTKFIRYQTSLCGPECVAKVLQLMGRKPQTIAQIAKGCKRTDAGVSLLAIREYFEKLGVKSYALALNSQDFSHISTPAILSTPDHFVVICTNSGSSIAVYDPLTKSTSQWKLPTKPRSNFIANVIVFTPLSLN